LTDLREEITVFAAHCLGKNIWITKAFFRSSIGRGLSFGGLYWILENSIKGVEMLLLSQVFKLGSGMTVG
jgi:hypothetical protein